LTTQRFHVRVHLPAVFTQALNGGDGGGGGHGVSIVRSGKQDAWAQAC